MEKICAFFLVPQVTHTSCEQDDFESLLQVLCIKSVLPGYVCAISGR